ncbi:MAG: hypothetical protein K9L82_05825 [Chromatiaceae bacterium]|nr:hypothetical protein [Chromatiaceae bacterium]
MRNPYNYSQMLSWPRQLARPWVIANALLLLLFSQSAGAWHTFTHPLIVEAAYNALPVDIQQAFRDRLDDIKRGSIAPDLLGDWINHEIDLHPSIDFSRPESLLNLQATAAQVVDELGSGSSSAAQRLGEFFHYAQDHLHPLHTGNDPRETALLHRQQEQQTYARRAELPQFADPGIRRWDQVMAWAEVAIPRANRLYSPWVEAAVAETDSFPLAVKAFHQAVADTRDLWVSLWYQAFPEQARMHLQLNRTALQPGQGVRMTVSPSMPALDSSPDRVADAITSPAIELSWTQITDGAVLKTEAPVLINNQTMVDAPLIEGDYRLTAQHEGQSSDVLVKVRRQPFFDISTLAPLAYVLEARWPHSPMHFRQSVQPWDFIAVGGCRDDPMTELEEGIASPFIPGDFTHLSVYLGRDAAGRPIAMELTDEIRLPEITQLRITVLPEGSDEAPDRLGLPQVEIGYQHCDWRWSRPLQPADRDAVADAADTLIATLQRHWQSDFPYQLPYLWSGQLLDRNVWLIDDGLELGANCTDYWLSVLEEVAGVCLTGTRMSAAEITAFFQTDPIGSKTPIPDFLNPLPFPVTAKDILNLGYTIIDPAPHRFSCDGTEETGLAFPSPFILSPDLGQSSFLPTAAVLPPPSPWWALIGQLYQRLQPDAEVLHQP